MSITFGVWASMVNPAKTSAQRRKIGCFRDVLGAPGKAEKGRFDGHGWT